ncbi:MAG: 23S rRNA (guanosine(2251)-2'-O)-methyltransferase RlmB [Proteobacteria bacterium]|nr:23S rRNA (guanosine(2251)-2'-O)-methyltransferase RlmB [Pseudomonadota bacterium]
MNKTEILYGIHPVSEAIKAGRRKVYEVYIAKSKDSKRFADIIKLSESMRIPVKTVESSHLEKIAGSTFNQGIGAMTSIYPLLPFDDILEKITPEHKDFFLLLDNIVDPQNLGSLVRTALCAGVSGVVITKDRSALPTPSVSKASAGALEYASVSVVTNMVSAIKELKDKGIWIAGMDAAADMPVYKCDLSGPVALVVGSEGKGIRPLVKVNCDFLISIPQKGSVSSLNASAAGAVAMYEAFRQRNFTAR